MPDSDEQRVAHGPWINFNGGSITINFDEQCTLSPEMLVEWLKENADWLVERGMADIEEGPRITACRPMVPVLDS